MDRQPDGHQYTIKHLDRWHIKITNSKKQVLEFLKNGTNDLLTPYKELVKPSWQKVIRIINSIFRTT